MPVVASAFHPPAYLRNGHLQTILPALFPRRLPLVYEPELLELPDGDFLNLDWARAGCERLAILSHGLESDSSAGYIRGMAAALNAAGWDALAWNFRSCGPQANRLLRSYHSGETGDLRAVVRHAGARYSQIALVGFSLGGNVTLKFLGEAKPPPEIVAAATVSVPVDLAASAKTLDGRRVNRIYVRRFLKTLVAKIEAKARRFPDQLDTTDIRRIASFQEFDDRYTSVLHDFRDAADYWAQSSSRQYLARIETPTLLVSARNDPFLAPTCFPFTEAEANPHFFLETPASGGHVGFVDRLGGTGPNWIERRVTAFLAEHANGGSER
jgi:predicted alpha/beta-fold hydrolase